MTIGKIRNVLYATARLLGDVSAVVHHHVIRRIDRRLVGRMFGRILGKLFR